VDAVKHTILVSRNGAFFLQKDTVFEKRGTRVFAFPDSKSAYRILEVLTPSIVIVNATDDIEDVLDPKKKFSKLALKTTHTTVLIVNRDDMARASNALSALTDLKVLGYPWKGTQLLNLTSKALDTGNRKYARVLVQVKIRKETVMTVFGFSRNIGTNGMLLESEVSLSVDESVAMSFMLPGTTKMIEVKSVVTRRQEVTGTTNKLYGMVFEDPDPAHLETIATFLSRKG
jgi:hypothetical protein